MSYSVLLSLLTVLAMLNALHGEIYLEPEHEGTIHRRCRSSLSCFPSQLEWAELEQSMTGFLVWPDDSNYTVYNYQFNLITETFPMVHVICKNTKDIQLAVKFAKKHNLRVTIKSKGNELFGKSSAHGSLSINLMEMKHISVNTEATARSEHGEVTVETGINSMELYKEVEKHDRTILVSRCAAVTPGGWITGGGFGRFSPALGLGVDNVLEMKVVLADGRVATCTHNKTLIDNGDGSISIDRHGGDLFWALRGGGGGTFGIIVHYVMKLHPSQPSYVMAVVRGSLHKNESDRHPLQEFASTFAGWARTAPNYWAGSIVFFPGVALIRVVKYGPWDENSESELQAFIDFQSDYSNMFTIDITNVSNADIADVLVGAGSPNGRNIETGALIESDYNKKPGVWDLIIDTVIENHAAGVGYSCSAVRLGGKVAEYDATSSSLHPGFRRAHLTFAYAYYLPTDDALSTIEEQERLKPLAAKFQEKLTKFQDGQHIGLGYVPSPNWKLDFWGEHYAKLLKIKIRYDPDNFFTCYHCVGSDWAYFNDMFDTKTTSAAGRVHLLHLFILMLSVLMYLF